MLFTQDGNRFKRLDITDALSSIPELDLSPDIVQPPIVIDRMDPTLKQIGPHRYAIVATNDPNRSCIIRHEIDTDLAAEFVCSEDNYADARARVSTLNAAMKYHTQDRQRLVNRITNLLEDRDADNTDDHQIAMAILSLGGFNQFQEFQSLIYEHDRYNSSIPFTLSAKFAQLIKVNRLANKYAELVDFQAAILPMVTPAAAAEDLVIILEYH